MTTLYLSNDANLSADDWDTVVQAVQYFTPLVTKAWKLPAVSISTVPVDKAWKVIVTDQKRVTGATGYHTVEAGIPVAYCSPKAVAGKIFGLYHRPMTVKGKVIRPATYSSGLITTVCHEIAEMLCDPKIATVSAQDSQSRTWLVEVCDHVFGNYITETFNGHLCILPDVTTPSFYDLKGKAPYSLTGAATAPFTMTPKGYGYYKTATGGLVKL